MLFEPRANRGRLRAFAILFERWHVRRRRWRRRAEEVLEQPLSANHRRCAVPIGTHRQDAPLTKKTEPSLVGQPDAPEMVAVHIRNPVVPRELLVQERVVRGQELADAVILPHLAVEEKLRFLLHRLPQVVVEIWEQVGVRRGIVQLPQPEPLAGKVLRQRRGPRISQHPSNLLLQHGWVAQLSSLRHSQELIVWNAGPEEERQPRRQLEIADPVGHSGPDVGRVALHPEQKCRLNEERLQRPLDPGLEISLAARRLVRGHQLLNVRIRVRSPIRSVCQARQDLSRAWLFFGSGRRLTAQNTTAAWRVVGIARREGTDDLNTENLRINRVLLEEEALDRRARRT